MAVDLRIGRIIVALDDSIHALAALEGAATIAETLEAELVAVHVEDDDLLRAAGLPFAVELMPYASGPRAMSASAMQRALRLRAARLRRVVEAAAARHHLRWRFRSVCGHVAHEILTAADDADMLVLGKAGASRLRRLRLGTTARAVVAGARRTVVVVQQGAPITRPVFVLYDGSDAADRALATATRIAGAVEDGVLVLLPRGEAGAAAKRRAASFTDTAGVHVGFVEMGEASPGALLNAVRRHGCRTLVVNDDSRLLGSMSLADLLGELDCPAIVVR